jgi:hypothetical protein
MVRQRKKVFCTFADGKVHTSSRLSSEISRTHCFDEVVQHSPETLGKDFHATFHQHLLHRRGYGFWSWKPWIVRMELRKLRDGDFLVYADSGCSVSPQRTTVEAYQGEFPKCLRLLLFKFLDQPELELLLPRPTERWLVVEWAKADLLKHFGCHNSESVLQMQMYEAGRLMIRRTDNVMRLVDDWCNISARFDLISDFPSSSEEHQLFKEHRHDQAIFNLLLNRLRWTVGLENLLHAMRYKD